MGSDAIKDFKIQRMQEIELKANDIEFKKSLVCLDSNHSHEHVLKELSSYSSLVSKGSYCIVFDTIIDELPASQNRNWGPNNSPKSAVDEFISNNAKFKIDKTIDNKILISVAPNGYLKRIS